MIIEIWDRDSGQLLYCGTVTRKEDDPPKLLENQGYFFGLIMQDAERYIYIGPYDREAVVF